MQLLMHCSMQKACKHALARRGLRHTTQSGVNNENTPLHLQPHHTCAASGGLPGTPYKPLWAAGCSACPWSMGCDQDPCISACLQQQLGWESICCLAADRPRAIVRSPQGSVCLAGRVEQGQSGAA